MSEIPVCMDLMRRLPPNKVEQNLSGLLNLLPDSSEELLQRVDQPLGEAVDCDGRTYLKCDYNRDGDSYRSPWSNKYDPPLDDGVLPSDSLRALEADMNDLFEAYRELYYEGGASSVYLWEQDDGFAGCFLVKKAVQDNEFVKTGSWDSIHVIDVKENKTDKKFVYKLMTTVMLNMTAEKSEIGNTNMSGSLQRQSEATSAVTDPKTQHASTIGRMIEDMEIDIRSSLHELYILKTREVVNSLRAQGAKKKESLLHMANLKGAISSHGMQRKVDNESEGV